MKKFLPSYIKAGLILPMFVFLGATVSIAAPKNVIGISPIQNTNNHIGFGFSLERFVGKKAKFSVVLPFALGWEMETNGIRQSSRSGKGPRLAYFFNPGLKFYPFGNNRFFTYSFGLSAFTHEGESTQTYGGAFSGFLKPFRNYQFYTAGFLFNNYLTFKINKAVSFGLELGFGPTIINNYKVKGESLKIKGGTMAYQNLAFQLAYRF